VTNISTPPLETHALSKRFGAVTALASLDLALRRGEVFGLIGPNGAGKTTTMRLLLDLIRPSGGTVTLLGTDPRSGGAALRRRVGYLPGELRLEGRITARTALEQFARISGPVAGGTIERLAERLGLELKRRVGQLSKGNKQKLGIIQAFMHQPDLLVLDEPTSGLDPLVQQEFLSLVTEASAAGQTVLLSSHVLSEVERAADRVAVLHEGRLVRLGTIGELRLDRHRRVRAVLHAPQEVVMQRLMGPATANLSVGASDAGTVVEGQTDDVDALVKALAGFELKDLVVLEPALEETILALYRQAGPHPAASPHARPAGGSTTTSSGKEAGS
jgi:ABC-2 type transport system ATP-binding protein